LNLLVAAQAALIALAFLPPLHESLPFGHPGMTEQTPTLAWSKLWIL
jgi:hypothetical protein